MNLKKKKIEDSEFPMANLCDMCTAATFGGHQVLISIHTLFYH